MDHTYNTPEGWDATVKEYDAGSPSFTAHYARALIEQSPAESTLLNLASRSEPYHATFLDVAGGTGAISLPLGKLIKRLKEEGKLGSSLTASVIASDFSPKMVESLAQHASEESLTDVLDTRVLDGMALALEDNSVDVAFSNFGLFLFPDRSKGFKEILRVLKPGGAALVSSWMSPAGPGINVLLGDILKLHFEALSEQAPAPSPSGGPLKMALGTVEEFEQEMKEAGFTQVSVKPKTFELRAGSELILGFMRTNPIMRPLREKVGSRFEEFAERAIKERFPSGELVMPTAALLGIGYKQA